MIAFFVTFPILATYIVFWISKKVYRHQWKAIHLAVNWTTILYIFSTFIILKIIYNQYYLSYILVLLISILALIIIIQWKTKTEIIFMRAIKQLWRVCFLLFSASYFILILIGIVKKMFT